jgi:D-hexose-6-phosphate mutarotase
MEVQADGRVTLPGSVRLERGAGGLERLVIDGPAAKGEIYLHGAHVTGWQPRGHAPVIWLSPASAFAAGSPIRGGVPICFPWFGAHASDASAPGHGFARLHRWALESAREQDGAAVVALRLATDAAHPLSPAWPHAFAARHIVSFGERLDMRLEIENPGPSSITFEEALHTYFAISDIWNVTVSGLEGTEYLDKVGGSARRRQEDEAIRFTGETDRVYLATQATCTIHDPGLRRDIVIAKQGSDTTVVWNPWIDKTARLADLPKDGWTEMVCVETCNAGASAITLRPGERHEMSAELSVRRR